MFRKILPILITFILCLIPTYIYANDIDITCYPNQKPLIVKNTDPLFVINGFMPGDVNSKNIKIVNTDTANSCDLSIYPSGNTNSLGNKIIVDISTVFSDTLNTFINTNNINVVDVPPSSTVEIPFTLTFLSNSDNLFMNKNISFDFSLGFVYGAPQDGQNGDIQGETDVNGTSYTSANGTVNEVVTATGAPDDKEEVLSEDDIIKDEKDVLGECSENTYWWIPLVVQIFLTLIFLLLINRNTSSNIFISILSVLVAVIAYIVGNRIGCPCNNPTWLCINHIYINILLGLLPLLGTIFNTIVKRKVS